MSNKRVLVVTCDRCGFEEHTTENPDPLNRDDLRFMKEHGDWGVVKHMGDYLDLCPACNEEYKSFFSNFFSQKKKNQMGGSFDETR